MAVHLAFVVALRYLGVVIPHHWFWFFALERQECGMKDGIEVELEVVWRFGGLRA